MGVYLSNQIPSSLWATLEARHAAGGASLGMFLGIGTIAINLFIGGTLAVVTDARRLSLSNPRTRKGFAILWLGAAALILGLIVGQFPSSNDDVLVEWMDATGPLAIVLIGLGMLLVRTGWKYDVRGARDVLFTDTRPPVIYLRSFQDDVRSPVGGAFGMWLKVLMWVLPVSFEQELAAIMNRLGPFVAVGRPGEKLPELGANRFYFRDDEWQVRVAELVRQAQLTVILCGTTANLWWEIDHVLQSATPNRVLLVIPERGKHTRPMEEQLEQRLGFPGALVVDNPDARSPVTSLLFGSGGRSLGKIVYFARDWQPRVQPITYMQNIRASLAMLRRPFSVYGAPLEAAFTAVFTTLDLPWTPAGPSRTIAIVLAATVGYVGGHHWYLGDHRRALKYALFFWTMVPILLAIRDAVRLVLMDQEEFERRFSGTVAASEYPARVPPS
jgi:TM2 domain-containing membrane protein YozV